MQTVPVPQIQAEIVERSSGRIDVQTVDLPVPEVPHNAARECRCGQDVPSMWRNYWNDPDEEEDFILKTSRHTLGGDAVRGW